MIVIQSVLTAVLAICIAVNAIYVTCKQNPHDKKRKELEKQRDADLTPLGPARNSLGDPLFLRGTGPDGKGRYSQTPTHDGFHFNDTNGQSNFPLHHMTPAPQHSLHHRTESNRSVSALGLVQAAAPMPYEDQNRYHDRHQSGQFDEHQGHPVGTARGY